LSHPPGLKRSFGAPPGVLSELAQECGASWSRQTGGVSADLLNSGFRSPLGQVAGSGPRRSHSSDHGRRAHWKQLVPSTVSEDLAGFRATRGAAARLEPRNTRSVTQATRPDLESRPRIHRLEGPSPNCPVQNFRPHSCLERSNPDQWSVKIPGVMPRARLFLTISLIQFLAAARQLFSDPAVPRQQVYAAQCQLAGRRFIHKPEHRPI